MVRGTMNANRLIEEWRQQGRILEVEGANTVLWRMGQGETVICVHGVPTSGFLYRKLLPELARIVMGYSARMTLSTKKLIVPIDAVDDARLIAHARDIERIFS